MSDAPIDKLMRNRPLMALSFFVTAVASGYVVGVLLVGEVLGGSSLLQTIAAGVAAVVAVMAERRVLLRESMLERLAREKREQEAPAPAQSD